jgi:hypothetical protein
MPLLASLLSAQSVRPAQAGGVFLRPSTCAIRAFIRRHGSKGLQLLTRFYFSRRSLDASHAIALLLQSDRW